MRTVLAIGVGCALVLALITSFSEPLGLDLLWPQIEARKSQVVGALFLIGAVAGLFHRVARRRRRANGMTGR